MEGGIMPTLTNVIVNKVYEGKSGEGQYGPWQAYNFYVRGDVRKFSCFDSKLVPREGMAIDALEFEEEQKAKDGKWYTNNNIKTVILPDTQEAVSNIQRQVNQAAPQTVSEPRSATNKRDSSLTMYISYAKDIAVALLNHKSEQVHNFTVEEIGDIIVQVGINMYDKANGVPKTVTNAPEVVTDELPNMPDNTQEPQYHGDEPPLGEPPYGT